VNAHLVCLTVDTDPDGLSGKVTNRQTLTWQGLENLQRSPELTEPDPRLGKIPITWFVRADGQLESILGSAAYLIEKYDRWWTTVRRAGHEIGWHPHLYRHARAEDRAVNQSSRNFFSPRRRMAFTRDLCHGRAVRISL
jgi:hypothetical protein